MRFGLFQAFVPSVRMALLGTWAIIAVSVIAIGSRSPESNHPVGLLLLGLGLAGPGIFALAVRLSATLWSQVIEEGQEERDVRNRLYALMGLGLTGCGMIWSALNRLL